ncbi:restriction endonuclease subunit S [Staphylococcus equorum]|uniref:restriction endonuclease subunit S n=1 Tax=Staphylococcus equorum TaxID=246432 RepID=UPI003FD8E309
MTNEVKNVPDLRFPNFEGEWEEKKLGDLVSIISGYSPSYYSIGGEYPLYKVNDLNNNNKYQIYSELYVSKKGEPTSNKTIIFPKRGAAILLNKIRIMITPGYIDTNLMGLQFEDINNTEFYYYTILKEGLFKIADTSTIPQINNKHILNYKINLPDNSERNKLGDFFNKLDQQIELEEQKLTLLEKQKKGYMQKVFSQELRFKDENGNDYDEWKEEKLENIADFQNGKAHENLVSIEGEYVLVNSKFISTDTRIKKHVSQQLTPLNKEDIAIVMSDIPNGKALAKCFLIDENNKYSLNQRIGRIYNILGDSRFLYLILNRNKQLLKYDSGVGQTNLKKSEITDILLNWPIKEEQQKIGDFFRKIDELIEKQSEKIEVLKMRKKGFLQKMFV